MLFTRRLLYTATLAALLLIIAQVLPASAQDDTAPANGRFCVRLFEDRNENAVQDVGEPAITSDVVADLIPTNGEVVLASTLVETAPNARAGEVCFADLQLGLYEIRLASAAYRIPGGDNRVFTELTETQPVITSAYGVPPRTSSLTEVVVDTSEVDRDAVLERTLISSAGALIAMALMAFMGLLIYLLFVRKPVDRRTMGTYPAYYAPGTQTDTGSMRQVEGDDYDYNSPPTR